MTSRWQGLLAIAAAAAIIGFGWSLPVVMHRWFTRLLPSPSPTFKTVYVVVNRAILILIAVLLTATGIHALVSGH